MDLMMQILLSCRERLLRELHDTEEASRKQAEVLVKVSTYTVVVQAVQA